MIARPFPLLLLLASCATSHYASISATPTGPMGPRWLTIVADENDTLALSERLEPRGFRVTGPDSAEKAPYVLKVHGHCPPSEWLPDFVARDIVRHVLTVELIDLEHGRHVLTSTLDDLDDCPDAFYNATANAIVRLWATGRTPPSASR
jgi:hypothetical protein